MLEYIHHCLFFPIAQLNVAFSRSENIAAAIIEGH
jgi:hypothetical protein